MTDEGRDKRRRTRTRKGAKGVARGGDHVIT